MPNSQIFSDAYLNAFQIMYSQKSIKDDDDIEALALLKRNEIEAFRFVKDSCERLNLDRPQGIGSGERFITPQLDIDTSGMSLLEATRFGKTLIEYAAHIDPYVGSFTQYGCCLATALKIGDRIDYQMFPAEFVDISKLMYH